MTDRKTEITIRSQVQKDFAIRFIQSLSDEKVWSVSIGPYRKKRSLDQNSLIHGHFSIIARETGHTPAEVKEWLKAEFLPPQFVEINGKTVETRPETSKLTTKELAEFADRVMAWAASELGIILPTRDTMRDAA